jgi:hypothetical protein
MWECDYRIDCRPPTSSSTEQSVEIFWLQKPDNAVNTDVGVRLQDWLSPSHFLLNRTFCRDLNASSTKLRCKYRRGSATMYAATRFFRFLVALPHLKAHFFCCLKYVRIENSMCYLDQVGGRHQAGRSPSHLLFNRTFCRDLNASSTKLRCKYRRGSATIFAATRFFRL